MEQNYCGVRLHRKFAKYQFDTACLPPPHPKNFSLTQFSSVWHSPSPSGSVPPDLSSQRAVNPIVGFFDFNLTGHNSFLSRRPLAQDHDHVVVHLVRFSISRVISFSGRVFLPPTSVDRRRPNLTKSIALAPHWRRRRRRLRPRLKRRHRWPRRRWPRRSTAPRRCRPLDS